MRPIRTTLIVALIPFVVFMSSCHHMRASEEVNVIPGIGIPNMIEIGMNLRDITNINHDVVVDIDDPPRHSYSAYIPSLRTYFWSPHPDSAIASIRITTTDSTGELEFEGFIDGKVHFRAGTSTSREEVIESFGEPNFFYTISPTNYPKEWIHILHNHKENGDVVSSLLPANEHHGPIENIFYPGVVFHIRDDVVTSARIEEKLSNQGMDFTGKTPVK